uniref:Uncharacterized protein n=1 Tax=Steinernema glaseri TaxID=37863 RepID=A0A1I7Z216_9BILA
MVLRYGTHHFDRIDLRSPQLQLRSKGLSRTLDPMLPPTRVTHFVCKDYNGKCAAKLMIFRKLRAVKHHLWKRFPVFTSVTVPQRTGESAPLSLPLLHRSILWRLWQEIAAFDLEWSTEGCAYGALKCGSLDLIFRSAQLVELGVIKRVRSKWIDNL